MHGNTRTSSTAPPTPTEPIRVEQTPHSRTNRHKWDDIEDLCREPDPLRQGARATELIDECRELVEALAGIRRSAIDRARHEKRLTFAEVADALGITKGRLAQIRRSDAGDR